MTNFLLTYGSLIDDIAINALLAFSQYIVLRAGVFSIATAGYAAIGAYGSAILSTSYGIDPYLAITAGTAFGAIAGALMAIPLAQLRGVFQAIASLAFVQIILFFNQTATWLTGGATGINSIPKATSTSGLICVVVVLIYVLRNIERFGIGRSFDVLRQDETVAVALGVRVAPTHFAAFVLSGTLGGLAGALSAHTSYSIAPELFGFPVLVACLSFVILGGSRSVWGALVGALVLTMLPEVARPLKEYRLFVQGALLILVITFLEHGIVDTIQMRWRALRLRALGHDQVLPQAVK